MGEAGLEDPLAEANRLASVGLLAGGIAYDFDNILGTILDSVVPLRDRLGDRPEVHPDLEEIEVAARWGVALTRELLAYSRRQGGRPRTVDLNDLAGRIERLLRRVVGPRIELVVGLHPSPALVRVDAGQVEHVLVSLGLHARNAMPEGGRLGIETAPAEPGRLGITISDTGAGVLSESTGLGVAINYGVIWQNGGQIEVSRDPDRGSRYRISFPRVEVERWPTGELDRGGRETVLIAEDEAVVRRVAARTLRLLGYTVLEAVHGREALELAARHPGTIHLLVTDDVMPHVSGRALAEELRRARPGIRVLHTSGYPANHFPGGRLPAGSSFLDKPYDPSALARHVRDLLDERGEGAAGLA